MGESAGDGFEGVGIRTSKLVKTYSKRRVVN